MEIRIKDYIIRPDNGSTWQLSRVAIKKSGNDIWGEGETVQGYPKDVYHCILRIREDMRREDPTVCNSFNEWVAKLQEIDIILKDYINKAIIT